jgi:small subunit ribosomal protein S17
MAKILTGKVTSVAMQNTIVVEVTRHTPHPLYKKLMKKSKKYHVDPRGIDVKIGEMVSIMETKPMAKNKHFALIMNKNTSVKSESTASVNSESKEETK